MYLQKIILIFLGLFTLLGCSSLKINVDYDPDFLFTQQKSFCIVHHNKEGDDTLFNERFIKALGAELNNKDYIQEEKSKADLIFVFHVNVESKTDIDRDYMMVGYDGHMLSNTHTYKYTKGTLIIDALNPKNNKIVRRSIATDILKSYARPTERITYIQKLVKEVMKDFPSRGNSQ